MSVANSAVRTLRFALKLALYYDNQLIGALLLVIAGHSWFELFRRFRDLKPFIAHGLYTLPAVNLLVLASSAVYITAVSIISLVAKNPQAKYDTLAPNLITLTAAFSVYCFGLLPASESPIMPVLVPLSMMALGGALILFSLVFLRRAFSVTPQARHLVNKGPYAIVRHPMYDGNIITFLGLAVLVGTLPAMLLFLVTAALQIYRANREERLLENTVPDYAAYKARVGAFLPKWSCRRINPRLLAAAACLAFACPTQIFAQGMGRALVPGPIEGTARAMGFESLGSPIIKVQNTGIEGRCRDWYSRALGGGWFTQQDKKQFDATDSRQEELEKLPGCRDFFRLQSKCAGIYYGDLEKPATMLRNMEAAPGCKSIIGFENICEALKDIKTLSASRQVMLSECLNRSVVASRAGLLRPGL